MKINKLQILKVFKNSQQLTSVHTNHCPGRTPWFGLVMLQPGPLLCLQVCQREDEPGQGFCCSVGVPLRPGGHCLGQAEIHTSISYLPGVWAGADLGRRPVPLSSPLKPSSGDSGTPDTRCSFLCKDAVIMQNWSSKLSPVHLQPGGSETAPSLRAKGDATCPNALSQN